MINDYNVIIGYNFHNHNFDNEPVEKRIIVNKIKTKIFLPNSSEQQEEKLFKNDTHTHTHKHMVMMMRFIVIIATIIATKIFQLLFFV